MEEYVTRAEFLEFKRQVERRQTEEMKAINVNVGSQDVLDRLDALEKGQQELKRELTQELKAVSDTWLETMQEHYTEHTARFDKIEESMAVMKEDIIDAIRKYSQPGKN